MRATSLAVALLPLLLAGPSRAEEPTLSPADEELLVGLLEGPLFDPPPGAKRVRVPVQLRTCWASSHEVEREAWLLPATQDRPATVVFTDGRSEPAPPADRLREVDLVAAVQARFAAAEGETEEERWRRRAMAGMQDQPSDPDLALAAWLFRRGEEGLAARLLAEARKDLRDEQGSLEEALAGDLAWECFAGLVHAFMVRADEEALGWGQRLLERYPEQAKAHPQAATIVAELRRRKEAGTFGKEPPAGWPEGFEARPPAERATWLVQALEEVDARQFGQPGGVDLTSDRRVRALIELGDVAVPALIEAVEKDERLTRSVHFWRDFARARTVLSVREAALAAAMSILRMQLFEARSTGDNFTVQDPASAARVARRLRDYWEANKGLTLEERMRRALLAPEAEPEQLREAARNLATLGGTRRIGTTVWTGASEPRPAGQENPALRLADPSAAEAIFGAMQRDLAGLGPDEDRRPVERHYLECLITLGDRRMAGQARELAEAAHEVPLRRGWSLLAHALGDPAPLEAFMAAFARGELELPAFEGGSPHGERSPGEAELVACVEAFVRAGGPAADAALRAPAAPDHPWHARVRDLVLSSGRHGGWETSGLYAHPWFLSFLRPELDRTEPTGTRWRREGDTLHHEGPEGGGSQSGGQEYDPAEWAEEAEERRCDRAAARISMSIVGAPDCHALRKDRDERLAELRALCDRHLAGLRRPTPQEASALGFSGAPWEVRFIPALAPLGRAATPEDVAAGRALFELEGQGKPLDLALPAVAQVRTERGLQPALVVQAEERDDGARRYGVIAADWIGAVGGDQVATVEPFPDPVAQAAAARRFVAAAREGKTAEVEAMLGAEVKEMLAAWGGLEGFLAQLREALEQRGEEELLEHLARGFRQDEQGAWRLERLR